MEVACRFPVPVGIVPWRDDAGSYSPFAKLTFDLGATGWAILSQEQVGTSEGESEGGRVLRPSDFAEAKGACEIAVVGRSLVEPTGAVRVRVGANALEAPRGGLLGPVAIGGGRKYFSSEAHRVPFPGVPLEIAVEGFGETLRSLLPAPAVDFAYVVDGAWQHVQRIRSYIDAILIEPRKRRCCVLYRGFLSHPGDPHRSLTLIVDPLGLLDRTGPAELATWGRQRAIEASVAGHDSRAIVEEEDPDGDTPPFGRVLGGRAAAPQPSPAMTLPMVPSTPSAQPLPFARKPAVSGAPRRAVPPARSSAPGQVVTQAMPAQAVDPDRRGTLPFIAPPQPAPPVHGAPPSPALPVHGTPPQPAPPVHGTPPQPAPPVQGTPPQPAPPVHAASGSNVAAAMTLPTPIAPPPHRPATEPPTRAAAPPEGATRGRERGETTQLINLRALEESRAALPFATRGDAARPSAEERGTRLDPSEAPGGSSSNAPALPFVRPGGEPLAPAPAPATSPPAPAPLPRRGRFDDDEHTAQIQLRPDRALPFDAGPATHEPPRAVASPPPVDVDEDRGDTLPPPPGEQPPWAASYPAALPPPPAFAVALSTLAAPPPTPAPATAQPVFRAQLVEPPPAPERATDKIPSLSLDEYAKLRAEIWSGERPRREILRERGLSELRWRAIERRWAAQIDAVSRDPQKLLPMLSRFQSYSVRIS